LHYKLNDQAELLYNYRFGGGSSVYQGTEKYALRDFTQQFHKLELKGSHYFVRAYMTETRDGDSWNMSAQGGFANEYYSDTRTKWAPEYAQTYVLAMQGYWPGTPAGDPAAAHAAARAYADRDRPAVGSDEFKQLMKDVRNNLFQGTPPGSSFTDNSRLYHAEFNYSFKNIKVVDVMVGGNYRQYSLFSDGTVFNEDPDGDGKTERVNIGEYGAYAQVSKNFNEKLKLTGSLRYDKNENFDGRVTPRVSAVYSVNENHNIRASFQTGFRNPDTQAQFIYFPSSSGTLLGSTKANAERYGVHEGGAYTQASYNAFRASGGTLDPVTGTPNGGDPSLLKEAYIDYVKPERLQSYEIGYKGLFNGGLLVDVNAYYTIYNDFIGGDIVAVKVGTEHQGNPVAAGSLYSPYVNKEEQVTSSGVGIGLSYPVFKSMTIDGSYNWATFDTETDVESDFRAGFNTPEQKFTVGLSARPSNNRAKFKKFGFGVNYRWQESFLWESTYGTWNVPEFGVMDAQVSYKISSLKTVAKIGGTNILGGDYRTNLGSPFVGQQFYISLTFDPLNK
jgi:outer membrane receptor protein involved in Fe transport